MNDAAVFWSYAHKDDEDATGGILRLARQLQKEYSLLTGTDLDLFVDRELKWGELWRERIDSSLSSSTFLVPVLTPRYFRRDECRRELREFHAQAQAYGVGELLLPIYYIPIADFGAAHPDELVVLAARSQFADWTALRLAAPDSPAYLETINKLARRLVEVTETVARRQVHEEALRADGETDPQDFYEALASVKAKWPALVEIIEQDAVCDATWTARWDVQHDRIARLRRSGRPGAVPALVQQMGRDLQPLAAEHLSRGQQYSARTLELDPLVRELFVTAGALGGERELLQDLVFDIYHVVHMIQQYRSDKRRGVDNSDLEQYGEKSHIWRGIVMLFRGVVPFIEEGNAIIEGWHRLAVAIDDPPPGSDAG